MTDLILGGREAPGAASFRVLSPYDRSVVAEAPAVDAAQARAAIDQAVGAEKTVGRQSRAERAAVLRKVSEGLLARKQELSLLLVREVGKTIREAQT